MLVIVLIKKIMYKKCLKMLNKYFMFIILDYRIFKLTHIFNSIQCFFLLCGFLCVVILFKVSKAQINIKQLLKVLQFNRQQSMDFCDTPENCIIMVNLKGSHIYYLLNFG